MKKLKRSGLLFCILVAILILTATGAGATGSLGITGPCYEMLSPTNSATEMALTWWDIPEVTTAYVQYCTCTDFGQATSIAATLTNNDTTNGYSAFEATMTGLAANMTYYYRVGNGGTWSETKSFTTGNALSTDNVSFIYLGDAQYGNYTAAAEEYAAWCSMIVGAYNRPDLNLDFALLGGDLVNQGQLALDWQRFFNYASPLFSKLPVLAVPGNHESNATSGKPELFLKLWDLPTNGPDGFKEEFYSYDYGNCHVVCLSSSIYLNEQLNAGTMTAADFDRISQWITADLANSDATWKIVVMHHPAYAVVSDTTADAVLANWEPIFADAQVDLVLCGHQHVYMRTKAMDGVTYVMGVSGSKFYAAPAGVSYSQCMIGYTSNYEIINADSNNLTVTAYNSAGNSLDTVTLAAKDRSITPVTVGDVNGDGTITSADVTLLITAICTNAAYSAVMDVNGDGKVNICDAHQLSLSLQ